MNQTQVGNRGAGSTGKRLGSRSGQALVFGSLSLTVLFATVGFATDLGYGYFTKMQLQTAADAAASAAAISAYSSGDSCSSITCGVTYTCAGVAHPTNSLEAGCLYATADAPSGVTVTMIENSGANPPSSLTGNIPAMWIQATVTKTNHNLFLYWSGFHSSTVVGQAIAGVTLGGCVYALSTNASPAVSVTGSSTLSTSKCGVYINSSASNALNVTGSSSVTTSGGGKIVLQCASCYNITGSSYTSPAAPYTVAAVSDPLSTLAKPVFSGCQHQTGSGLSSKTNYSLGNGNSDILGPGVYCGGITVGGAATLTMNAGTYIMNGGGFNIGNSGVVNATAGVFIYNTAASGETAGPVTIAGSAVVNLIAPNSGTYQGIAFFQDPNLTNAASISNSGTGNITGTYYFPKAPFSFTGNTTAATTAAFVASTITITGSSNLLNDSTGRVTGLAKTSMGLIQ